MNLQTYISLDEAAARYGLDLATLTLAVESGKIKAVKVNGGIAVSERGITAHAKLQTYIPLSEAAKRYGLDSVALTQAVESGKIKAVKVNGGIAVAEEDIKRAGGRRDELWAQVAHLDGMPVALEEACRRYKFGQASVYNWIGQGYVRVLEESRGRGRGHKRILNEADVAYIALVAAEGERRAGKRIVSTEYVPPHCTT